MSGEAEALGKILDGIKELGKALLPEERKLTPQATHKGTNPMTPPTGVFMIPSVLLDEVRDAWEDPEVMKHVPMGMARPLVRVLSYVYPEVT